MPGPGSLASFLLGGKDGTLPHLINEARAALDVA